MTIMDGPVGHIEPTPLQNGVFVVCKGLHVSLMVNNEK